MPTLSESPPAPEFGAKSVTPRGLDDWLAHLEGLHPKGQGGIELGLERVRRVKDVLQQKQRAPLIVVGGTNGKGSTCAYLEGIYAAAGYRVGCYTSPHLLSYNERVRVDGRPIDDATLCRAFAKVEAARQRAAKIPLTYFEFGTLAAWEVFAACAVEVLILEVGLGGRLDAVNVYDADCAIVTGVALDHMDWLGDTREAIGFEKAGIFRGKDASTDSGERAAICADPDPPQSLLAHAAAIGADLQRIGHDFDAAAAGEHWCFRGRDGRRREGLARPVLRGDCQLRNAAASIAAVDALAARLPVREEAIARGLAEVRLPGRFQVLPASAGRPELILDVAHNPEAAAVLAQNLRERRGEGRTIAVAGMLADKDIAGVLAALSGSVDRWFFASLDVSRGAPAAMLAAALPGRSADVECCATVAQAFDGAAKAAGENDRIVALGSFHTVAAVLRAIGGAA